MNYELILPKPGLWVVGSWDDDGNWLPESKHSSVHEASARVRILNNGYFFPPDPKEPFAPTRFDRLLEAAFQGLLSNPDRPLGNRSLIANRAIEYTKELMDLLEKEGL